jgi:hypothetical protein
LARNSVDSIGRRGNGQYQYVLNLAKTYLDVEIGVAGDDPARAIASDVSQ